MAKISSKKLHKSDDDASSKAQIESKKTPHCDHRASESWGIRKDKPKLVRGTGPRTPVARKKSSTNE